MKKNKNKVSVIMSTYNTDEEQLKLSISSVLKQTYENIELIIICDGNEEEYKRIINTYKSDKIKCILNKKNIGLAASLNKAIEYTTGEYIARMDSDDICLKNRIQKQVDFMEKHQEIDICGMFANCFGKRKNIMSLQHYKEKAIDVQLLYECCLIHPTIMFRKKFIIDNNIKYNEEFKCTQDYELWSRIVNNNAYVIPKVGLYYRIHNKQITSQKRYEQEKMTKIIVERNIEKIKEKYNFDAQYILYKLSALSKISIEDVKQLSEEIDKMIDVISTSSDKKQVKKIIYNKFLRRVINDELFPNHFIIFFCTKSLRKKIFNFSNIISIVKKCFDKIISIINLKYKLRKWENELIKI